MSKLHVVATPIGNLGDLSPRALEALKSSALIACEDTRRTWALLTHFGIPRPEMVSYRQGNEERLTERIIAAVESWKCRSARTEAIPEFQIPATGLFEHVRSAPCRTRSFPDRAR